jgi:hypothetical protein
MASRHAADESSLKLPPSGEGQGEGVSTLLAGAIEHAIRTLTQPS